MTGWITFGLLAAYLAGFVTAIIIGFAVMRHKKRTGNENLADQP